MYQFPKVVYWRACWDVFGWNGKLEARLLKNTSLARFITTSKLDPGPAQPLWLYAGKTLVA
jgi:hypothetical protein